MTEYALTGSNFIGNTPSHQGTETFDVWSRLDGQPLDPVFAVANRQEIFSAAAIAKKAFAAYSQLSGERRAEFLEAIAENIELLGDSLLSRANAETGLPVARLSGERGRTCGQLRMFANLIREGSWVEASIDHGDLARSPIPKPDLRRMLVPIGPVAVFGASNFPFAYSVAGGDTASALAAGCPVVVKAHPAHPGTSELVARAILEAAQQTGMPDGVFGMVHGGNNVGQTLVVCSEIYAVGFTGSQAGGRALYNLAATRPRPIPVYAEMGSVNPVFILDGTLKTRTEALAKGYAESLTLGVGQFCTNPGIVVGMQGDAFESFLAATSAILSNVAPGMMLTDQIGDRYETEVSERSRSEHLRSDFYQPSDDDRVRPALFATSGETFLRQPHLAEEVFGPTAIAIGCSSLEEMIEVANSLEGQLTATIHSEPSDSFDAGQLLPHLRAMAGRIVINGFPTGVEVNTSMVHGGPYPATTDSRSTSVGQAAITRFARPISFQNCPSELLPPELQESNPRQIWRIVDGCRSMP